MPSRRREVVARSHSDKPVDAVWALVADAPTWKRWARFTVSEYEREGEPAPHGVGAIRRFGFPVYTSREEVVAFEPPTHLGYILRAGLPLRGYRSDVTLTPSGDVTEIEWRSSFDGRAADGWFWQGFLRLTIGDFARRLARAAERQDA